MELAQQASNFITPTLLYSICHGVRAYSGLLQHAVVHVLANSEIGSVAVIPFLFYSGLTRWRQSPIFGAPFRYWGYSSVGRALEWHSRGQGFDSPYLHQTEGEVCSTHTASPENTSVRSSAEDIFSETADNVVPGEVVFNILPPGGGHLAA
jgi:hypothetical protein